MTLTGRRVVLGVSGGIACYKTCTVARRLTEMGAAVDVVLTASAGQFIRPVTFEALTGRPVATSLWDRDAALAHLSLGQDTDLIVVAPATAHLIARAAQGLADDLLTALLLAATVPVLLAPAMNDRMYAHPATQANLAGLMQRGWAVVGPEVGPLAEGPSGRPGRMSEPEKIIAIAARMIRGAKGPLAGKRVLVTAGPTRESLDPVRVVTNRSSGRMGFALATAAFGRGAEVTLITGPTSLEPPFGVDVVTVESTEDLRGAMAKQVHSAEVVVMAAAPADFRVPSAATGKIKRADGAVDLRLEPTVDVLESTKHLRTEGCLAIGFALETSDGVENARDKLMRKGLDLIVLNMANEPGAGFEEETNRVTLVGADSLTELPILPKAEVAERILDAVEALA
jgi:phosphopantothenoylcysteine decarboxylase/phosphopantothenate--cysteine ligase